ncbi:UNVERIFIED_CONTAM: hypothetical protein Sindi_2703200 [Sesamum indicum]
MSHIFPPVVVSEAGDARPPVFWFESMKRPTSGTMSISPCSESFTCGSGSTSERPSLSHGPAWPDQAGEQGLTPAPVNAAKRLISGMFWG